MNIFSLPKQLSMSNLSPEAQTFLSLLFLLVIVLWIWSLTDTLKRKDFKDGMEKLIWVFVIVSTFFLGTILYYFIEIRSKKTKQEKETHER